MDSCSSTENGDIFFARVPFKIYALLEGKQSSSTYFLELQYYSKYDLSQTVNRKKCYRRPNVNGAGNDNKIGSTIGGDFGYGYAKDSANDGNKEGSGNGGNTNTGGGGSSSNNNGNTDNNGGGSSGGNTNNN